LYASAAFGLRLCALHGRPCRGGRVLLTLDASLRECDLRVERLDVRPAVRDRVLVGPRVDVEEEFALLQRLVVDHVQLGNPAGDFGDDVDDVSHHGRVSVCGCRTTRPTTTTASNSAPTTIPTLRTFPATRRSTAPIVPHAANRTSQVPRMSSAARQA
jgi:hypothetical protein